MHRAGQRSNWIDILSNPLRDTIIQRMRSRSVADGEAVYAIGDPSSECYLIQSGRIRVVNYSRSGKEVQTKDFRDGDCFGEVGVIDGLPRSNNAYTVGRTELLVLKKPDFDRLHSQHPQIAQRLNLYLCHRLRMADASVEELSVLTLRERLPRLLSQLADNHGLPAESGAVVISSISQNDLAHMLGVARQSVSREIKELERVGLVRLRYRTILIPNISSFRRQFDTHVGSEPTTGPHTD